MRTYRSGLVIAAVAVSLLLAGCGGPSGVKSTSGQQGSSTGGNYKDGTYSAKSSPDELGGVGEITLTVEKGKITKADYKGIQVTGQLKDAEYGKTIGNINQDYYNKAQRAVKGAATYAPRLLETQDAEKIDAVSGATISYNQFVEATKKALDKAR